MTGREQRAEFRRSLNARMTLALHGHPAFRDRARRISWRDPGGWADRCTPNGYLFGGHDAGQRGNKDERSESASFTFGR